MSIFQIKSLQSLRTARKADPIADLKETGHETRSRIPAFVGASIAALIMYMKTAHAAAAPAGQGPVPPQGNGDAEQSAPHDEDVAREVSRATDMSLPPSRRMLPGGPDVSDDGSAVRSLGQWGWEITGNSRPQLHFGSDASSGMLGGAHVFGGTANDNAMAAQQVARSGALKSKAHRVAPHHNPSFSKPNRAPTVSGPVLLEGGFSAMAVLFTLDDLLQGAVDADKDTLHVFNVEASSGVIIPVEDGYMYIGDTTGPVTLSYEITDGQTIIAQQANFTVSEHDATLGTALADDIVGSDSGELIQAGGGNDTIHAGIAIDTIYGGDGNDEIHGGAGNDLLVGGNGNDQLFGDAGNDLLFAGAGNDEIQGGDGGDRAYGGSGDDVISGDAGDDMLFGDSGNDTIMDGTGQDYVDGGEGNDIVLAMPDKAADTLDGGAGTDTLSYAASDHGVVINIAKGEARGADIGTDTVQNFETFVGGQGDDTFVTGNQSVTLYGGEGEDVFVITVDGLDASAPVRHVIEDFEVGDRVRMSAYDIFEQADAAPDFLDQMKVDAEGEAPDNAVPIQFRFDEESGNTFIEADIDHDSVYETSVELDGQHFLQLHQHALA